jgi:hypothetical protein
MTGFSPAGVKEQPAIASRINATAENNCSLLMIHLLNSSRRFPLNIELLHACINQPDDLYTLSRRLPHRNSTIGLLK